MKSPDLNEFVTATEEFCGFAESDCEPFDGDLWRIRELLLRLIFHITAVESADHEYEQDAGDLTDDAFHHAVRRFFRFPVDHYLMMFDPHTPDIDEKPVMGMLSDDLSDIYRDLAEGLINWKNGYVGEACFHWASSYRTHWARHAVQALVAIETYRTDHHLSARC